MEESDINVRNEAGGGLSQLLFAPVFLVGEFLGIVMPGLVLCVVLFMKGHHELFAAFNLSFLGYRTKVFAFLLIAYVVGKVLTAPFRLSLSYIIEKTRELGDE